MAVQEQIKPRQQLDDSFQRALSVHRSGPFIAPAACCHSACEIAWDTGDGSERQRAARSSPGCRFEVPVFLRMAHVGTRGGPLANIEQSWEQSGSPLPGIEQHDSLGWKCCWRDLNLFVLTFYFRCVWTRYWATSCSSGRFPPCGARAVIRPGSRCRDTWQTSCSAWRSLGGECAKLLRDFRVQHWLASLEQLRHKRRAKCGTAAKGAVYDRGDSIRSFAPVIRQCAA